MEITNSPARAGKTYAMVHSFLVSNACLVVMNERERARIIKEYNVPEEKQSDIITWQNIREKSAPFNKPFYMDNADYFLQEFFGGKLKWITMRKSEPRT